MSPERCAFAARPTSSMYSAPRSLAAASCTAIASGLSASSTTRPSAVPTPTSATPPRPICTNRRREPSAGPGGRGCRTIQASSASATTTTASPATSPTAMLPSNVHTRAVRPARHAMSSTTPGTLARRDAGAVPGRASGVSAVAVGGRISAYGRRRVDVGLSCEGCVVALTVGLGALARQVEEGEPDDRGADLPTLALHAVFDRDTAPDLVEALVHRAESDHLLDRGAPRDRRRAADLSVVLVHGHRRPVHERGDHRREAVFGEHPLHPRPIELQADETPRGTVRPLFVKQRPPPVEAGRLPEADEPADPHLEGRIRLFLADRVASARVLRIDQDETGLDASHVERADPRREDADRRAGLEDRVTDLERDVVRDPQLVATVARVARARDADVDAADLGSPVAEVAHVGPVLPGGGLEHVAAELALQRETRERLGDVFDLDIEAGRVQQEPSVGRVGGRDPILRVGDACDRPVVEHLAGLVAPRRVVDLVHLELRDVARHDAVEQPRGVGSADHILVQRACVDHGGGLPDRAVLDVVEVRVHGGREVSRPLAPRLLDVQRLLAWIERGSDRHGASWCARLTLGGWVPAAQRTVDPSAASPPG